MIDPDDAPIVPGSDGEVSGGLTTNWDDKPKRKKGRSRWRRPLFVVRTFALIVPFVIFSIVLTLLLTGKLALGLDLSNYELYRRLCISTLGPNRIALGLAGEGVAVADLDSERMCRTSERQADAVELNWAPR